jgi:hypothetical protein
MVRGTVKAPLGSHGLHYRAREKVMPRAKPPEILKPRAVRMSDKEWEMFKHIGGANWLRSRLSKLNSAGIVKRQHHQRIRAAASMGKTHSQISKEFDIDRSTVWRILK